LFEIGLQALFQPISNRNAYIYFQSFVIIGGKTMEDKKKQAIEPQVSNNDWIKNDLLKIGLNVKHYRVAMGLNQQQLAELAGISKAILTRIESANVHIDHGIAHYMKLAKALGITLDELIMVERGEGDSDANTNTLNK